MDISFLAKGGATNWDKVFRDFSASSEGEARGYPGPALLTYALQNLARDKDTSHKAQLCQFVEEHCLAHLLPEPHTHLALALETLKAALSAPPDSSLFPPALRLPLLSLTTVLFIESSSVVTDPYGLQALIELLLAAVSRCNQAADRVVRSACCDALRMIETTWACMLTHTIGHLLNLAGAERGSPGQSYLLLLLACLQHAGNYLFLPPNEVSVTVPRRASGGGVHNLLSTQQPLLPFTFPPYWSASRGAKPAGEVGVFPQQELTASAVKDFRRARGVLLDLCHVSTEAAMVDLLVGLTSLTLRLGLGGADLRHNFYLEGLSECGSPMIRAALAHMHAQLGPPPSNSLPLSEDPSQPLLFRHLSVHWQMGGEASVPPVLPHLFDPLSLKAAKLQALALASSRGGEAGWGSMAVECTRECLMGFRHQTGGSLEEALYFQTMHRFLTAGSHSLYSLVEVEIISELRLPRGPLLLPSLLFLLSRLHTCCSHSHTRMGFRLMAAMQNALPLPPHLPPYLFLLEKLVGGGDMAPQTTLELIAEFVRMGGGGGGDWWRGTHLLSICRTAMVTHPSSRLVGPLTSLLHSIAASYPDLDIRDTASHYLHLLTRVPGRRRKEILSDLPPGSGQEEKNGDTDDDGYDDDGVGLSEPKDFLFVRRLHPLLLDHQWELILVPNQVGTPTPTPIPPTNGGGGGGDRWHEDVALLKAYLGRVGKEEGEGVGAKIHLPCTLHFCEGGSGRWAHQDALYGMVLHLTATGSGLYGPIPSIHVPYLRKEAEGVVVVMELSPHHPIPALIMITTEFTGGGGEGALEGPLESVAVGVEDLFLKPSLLGLGDGRETSLRHSLFSALWTLLGEDGGGEVGEEIRWVPGAESVKVLEVGAEEVVAAVEEQLSEFVTLCEGAGLVDMVREGGRQWHCVWGKGGGRGSERLPSLEWCGGHGDGWEAREGEVDEARGLGAEVGDLATSGGGEVGWLGRLELMIVLPPRYHLLLRLEVEEWSTLVRMRTDHWPCLAHIDDYLEALIDR